MMKDYKNQDMEQKWRISVDENIKEEAVFSDETSFFRMPFNPGETDEIQVRLRVLAEDIDYAEILSSEGQIKMTKEKRIGIFEYYIGFIPPSPEHVHYCFRIVKGEEIKYYGKLGVSDTHNPDMDFLSLKNFNVPSWAAGAVMYQIYVDRFCNGDKKNDVVDGEYVYLNKKVKKVEDWFAYPENDDVANFYGGDIQGIIDKLDYLSALGVEAVYLNPIFVSPSNHKYDIQDYEHVDPHFGKIVVEEGLPLGAEESTNEKADLYISRTTNEANLTASDDLFSCFIEKAHARGIRVIIDGVFNHCGAFNKWLDREGLYLRSGVADMGAFHDEESPYRQYFVWKEDGDYAGWWDFPNHPKLHYENSKALLETILNVGKKWVSPPFNADGWRMDVAADLGLSPDFNHYFWQEFRRVVKTANPQSIILAEHYGDPSKWLMGNEWDTVMNYDAFMDPVSFFLTGMEKHSDSFHEDLLNNGIIFAQTMNYNMMKLPIQSLMTSMNQLSNHDHSRFLTRTNHVWGRVADLGSERAGKDVEMAVMRLGVLIQMTWIGAPTVYYGDEAGLCGFTDPDNRRTFPWGKEDLALIQYHQQLIRIRAKHDVLKHGSTLFLAQDYGIIAYGRFNETDKMAVVINNAEESKTVTLPLWKIGMNDGEKLSRLFQTYKEGFGFSGKTFTVSKGCIQILMRGKSGVILIYES